MPEREKTRQQRGFTLLELLVSAFIIALVSGIFMVNYHSTNKRSELTMIKQKLASDIRMAQNNSLGSKTYDGDGGHTPKGGWGVHFDLSNPRQYIIFADKNDLDGNKTYDVGEAVESKNLPAGVAIDSLIVRTPVNTLDIVFFPPNPVTYINGYNAYDNQAEPASIILRESFNNSIGTVTVNLFGLIDTE
jgi:prepilin-type N-terminal cleavage/methylation domain-containing protein